MHNTQLHLHCTPTPLYCTALHGAMHASAPADPHLPSRLQQFKATGGGVSITITLRTRQSLM